MRMNRLTFVAFAVLACVGIVQLPRYFRERDERGKIQPPRIELVCANTRTETTENTRSGLVDDPLVLMEIQANAVGGSITIDQAFIELADVIVLREGQQVKTSPHVQVFAGGRMLVGEVEVKPTVPQDLVLAISIPKGSLYAGKYEVVLRKFRYRANGNIIEVKPALGGIRLSARFPVNKSLQTEL